jgi:hypothetical protein
MASARVLPSLIVVLLFSAGHERVTPGSDGPVATLRAIAGPAPTAMPPSTGCPVSKTVKDEPPKDPNADRFGFGDWYVNADRTIWVRNNSWKAGSDGNKVIWIRPAGTKLVITGRRIDAPASPPRATADRGYPTGFTVTGLYFESPGCWELTAKAGSKELHFVTEVIAPSAPRSLDPAS